MLCGRKRYPRTAPAVMLAMPWSSLGNSASVKLVILTAVVEPTAPAPMSSVAPPWVSFVGLSGAATVDFVLPSVLTGVAVGVSVADGVLVGAGVALLSDACAYVGTPGTDAARMPTIRRTRNNQG